MPNNLPLNWGECKLETVCALDNGLKQNGLDLPLLDAKYLRGKKEAEYRQEGVVLNHEDYVILVDGENSGEIFSIYETGIMGSTFKKLSFSEFCSIPYVLFFIKSKQDLFRTNKKGAAIPHLDKTLFKNLMLPLPPLAEQERIVDKIEALFQGIDEGVERLKSAQAQIKQYRQSVLKSAFEGKLYKTTDWKEKKLIDLTSKIGSGSTPNGGKNNYHTDGIPIIRSMNVHMNKFIYEGLAYLDDKQASQLNNVITQKDDVLLNITGASIGRTCLLPDTLVGARVNQHVSIVRTKNELLPQYLSFYFASPIMQTKITIENYGATRQALTKSAIENFIIQLPSLPEQQRIVEEIEKRFLVADELEKAVNDGLEKADKLKQSILKKAFEGKLVAQNPNDEPASVLLERIKKSPNPTKGKKK